MDITGFKMNVNMQSKTKLDTRSMEGLSCEKNS